jgi:hypothetical protein
MLLRREVGADAHVVHRHFPLGIAVGRRRADRIFSVECPRFLSRLAPSRRQWSAPATGRPLRKGAQSLAARAASYSSLGTKTKSGREIIS